MKRTGSGDLALTAALTASSILRESMCLFRYSCTDIFLMPELTAAASRFERQRWRVQVCSFCFCVSPEMIVEIILNFSYWVLLNEPHWYIGYVTFINKLKISIVYWVSLVGYEVYLDFLRTVSLWGPFWVSEIESTIKCPNQLCSESNL